MAKKIIRVHSPFTFTNDDGTSQSFEVGEYSVEDKVADHWFVQAHSEVTGKAKTNADVKDLQAQVDSLTTQLADKDKANSDLQAQADEKDATIAELNKQLEELKAPAAEGGDDVEKQKSTDSK